MNAENEKLVNDFCEAWSRRDVDEILSYLAEDCFYHNIPMRPSVGHAQIRKFIEPFLKGAQSANFEIVNTASSGHVVMNERVDYFTMGDKNLALPVMGVFEIRDGKIAAWRDYFDMATMNQQMA